MTEMQSRPVNPTIVYVQDTEPSVQRDGVMWVDSSEPSRPVYVYSADTGGFEPASPGNVTVSDTAPTGKSIGHVWVDTSADVPTIKVHDGSSFRRPGPRQQFIEHSLTGTSETITFPEAFPAAPWINAMWFVGGGNFGSTYDHPFYGQSRSTTACDIRKEQASTSGSAHVLATISGVQ